MLYHGIFFNIPTFNLNVGYIYIGVFYGILSIPYNIVMDLYNVMMHSKLYERANQCDVVSYLVKLENGHPTINHVLLHFEHL